MDKAAALRELAKRRQACKLEGYTKPYNQIGDKARTFVIVWTKGKFIRTGRRWHCATETCQLTELKPVRGFQSGG